MSQAISENAGLQIVDKLLTLGVAGGAPGVKSSIELAQDYLNDSNYESDEHRIASLVRWQVARTATTGFATGLGGLITLPVTLPVGMGAAWIVQSRMVGSIAHIRGYDLEDERVRTLALASLVGDATVNEVAKKVGIDLSTRVAKNAIGKIPGQLVLELNKKVGFRLLTKGGSTGVVNLGKAVPMLGGVVGGAFDGTSTRVTAGVARRAFPAKTA